MFSISHQRTYESQSRLAKGRFLRGGSWLRWQHVRKKCQAVDAPARRDGSWRMRMRAIDTGEGVHTANTNKVGHFLLYLSSPIGAGAHHAQGETYASQRYRENTVRGMHRGAG